ncbi:MAG: thiamine pyrophosphate-binding protein [Acidobacteria bacterium]|nr:thiamine pyrophosphate-binding protein [Acidobacteriota bacterium]
MARSRTGAEALVAQMEALGVEVVFGIPGVHNLPVFDALRHSSIRAVVVRHEQAAGYAADGYARATGRLGVCITTTGPGAANAAAAMGEARACRSPVLHVSTQIETRLLQGRGGRWSLPESSHQRDLMGAVCVWSEGVARAEAIPGMVAVAAREAFRGRRGPAFLEIPHDLLDARVPVAAPRRGALWEPVPPDGAAVARAARSLVRAERPAIWAGGGIISSGASEALRRVAEMLDAPVVTTFAGKGAIPGGHPLAVGFPPHHPHVTRLVAGSDALLVVGSDLDAMNTQGWRLPLPRPRVAINTVAQDARRNYAADVVVEADARLALEALAGALGERGEGVGTRRAGAGARRAGAARRAALKWLRGRREFTEPLAFVDSFAAELPPDAFVLGDMAVAGYWTAAYYPAPGPRAFAFPLGWGTLGFALPAAIGATAAGRRAVAVCGDAGLLFAAGELATAVQESLPVVAVVVNDSGYGMLRFDQDRRFGARFASDLRAPDFVALARAFGAKARRASLAGFRPALRWALRQDGPVLIEVPAAFAPPITISPRWPLAAAPSRSTGSRR